MIEFLAAPDHVGAYRLSGTLADDDLDRLIADLEARLERHERVGVLADVTGFHDVTIRAGMKDLRYSFGKLLDLRRFPREAVVTDKQWLANLANLAGPFVPFMAIRSFAPAERDAALTWVADIDPG